MLSQQDATDVGARSKGESEELPAGTQLGHYRIEGVVGRGGMGIVYRAPDTKLHRPVAIKFLSAAIADDEIKRRFQREAETASGLQHPHIVTVYDVGEHDRRQYIVSELITGGTLDDWANARSHSWRNVVELLAGVAEALAAAHAAGVLHRDVKPGNILIDANGYAKLADFGLAKLFDSSARDFAGRVKRSHTTQTGLVVGTVAYMSPEQATKQPLDARSDVFSFGIVLYELLAGRRPFDGANDLETLKALAHATPDALPDSVPELLRIAVEKALEKDPADRYQTMHLDPDGTIMVVDVLQSDGDAFEAGAPRPLIETGVAALPPAALPDFLYDAAPDGQRFLINEPISAPTSAEIPTERTVALKVVLNWSMGLDAR